MVIICQKKEGRREGKFYQSRSFIILVILGYVLFAGYCVSFIFNNFTLLFVVFLLSLLWGVFFFNFLRQYGVLYDPAAREGMRELPELREGR